MDASSNNDEHTTLYGDLKIPRDLAAKFIAVLALVISIAVGVFTIIDHTLIAPGERKSSDLSKLRDIVLEIGKANSTALLLMSNNLGLNAVRQMNSIKFPLLASATNIVDKHHAAVDADILLVLIGELLQIQNHTTALEYATLARKVARIPDTRIEATRLMALAVMSNCGEFHCPRGQALFEEALADARRLNNDNRLWLISNVLRDWSIQAIHMGQCEEASKILGRFATDVPLPLGRAPARLGFGAVFDRAEFTQICSKKEIEQYIDVSYFQDVIKQVFPKYPEGQGYAHPDAM